MENSIRERLYDNNRMETELGYTVEQEIYTAIKILLLKYKDRVDLNDLQIMVFTEVYKQVEAYTTYG